MILRRLSLLFIGCLWALTLLVEAGGALGVLVLPVLAFLGARLGIERSPTAWVVFVGAPGYIAVVLGGIVLHDPDRGASLWPLSMLFVILTTGLTALGCAVGGGWKEGRKEQNGVEGEGPDGASSHSDR